MAGRTAPKLALWLVSRLAPDEALIGDLVERYREGRSAVWFWKQVLWAIAISNLREIRTKQLQLFNATKFNPKGLIVSVVATGLILHAIGHPFGVAAVLVSAFLFGGLWRLIPDRWLTKPERPTR